MLTERAPEFWPRCCRADLTKVSVKPGRFDHFPKNGVLDTSPMRNSLPYEIVHALRSSVSRWIPMTSNVSVVCDRPTDFKKSIICGENNPLGFLLIFKTRDQFGGR